MENKKIITEYFEELETEKEHNGYYYKISDVITIVILGSICGLKSLQQIHQWAVKDRTSEFLKEEFGIYRIPCYYWLTCMLKIIKPESLGKCFENWVRSVMPEKADKLTVSLDGKTVCSTTGMKKYKNPLHIVSAQLSECGLTLAQRAVDGKSNEIPAAEGTAEGTEYQRHGSYSRRTELSEGNCRDYYQTRGGLSSFGQG